VDPAGNDRYYRTIEVKPVPKTVLLADDSLTIQRVVTLTFANEDVTITSVSDGDQAVESLSRTRPDLVLADIAMPGRSGYQVVEFVRSQPELSSLPVLLLAGAFDHIDEEHIRTVGADGVLTKPFEPAALIGQVKHLLLVGRPDPAAQDLQVPTRTPIAALAPPAELSIPTETPVPVVVETTVMPVETSASPVETPVVAVDLPVITAETPIVAVETAPSVSPEAPPVSNEAAAPLEVERVAPVVASPVDVPASVPNVVMPPMRTPSPDTYFDQIDQAFAALAKAPRPSLNLVPKPPVPATVEERRDEIVADLVEPKLVPAAAAIKDAEPAARTVPLSDAFNALLDAERTGVVDTTLRLSGVPAFSPVDVDALASQVAQRVLQQMSERVVRETVANIVSLTAERLVREEIEQVKRNIT
jgi:CheY-like chemotaxis protein